MRGLEVFASILSSEGPAAALDHLNKGVPHRYTAIYRFDGELLRNVLLSDKRGEVSPDFLLAVPFEHSFCQFVLRDRSFRTEDSRADPRLEGHPSRGIVISYHSVPLIADDGSLWKTLSHFDMKSHPLPEEDFRVLERAARLLGSHLKHLGR